jgi:hypothetical protein
VWRLIRRGRWTKHVLYFVFLGDGAIVIALSVRAVKAEYITVVGRHISSGLLLTFGVATTEHVFRCLQNVCRCSELILVNVVVVVVVVVDVVIEWPLPCAGHLSCEFVYHLTEALSLTLLVVSVVVISGVWVVIVADLLVTMSLICLSEILSCCCSSRRRFNLGLSHRHQHNAASGRRVPAPQLSSSVSTTDRALAEPQGRDLFLPSTLLIADTFVGSSQYRALRS